MKLWFTYVSLLLSQGPCLIQTLNECLRKCCLCLLPLFSSTVFGIRCPGLLSEWEIFSCLEIEGHRGTCKCLLKFRRSLITEVGGKKSHLLFYPFINQSLRLIHTEMWGGEGAGLRRAGRTCCGRGGHAGEWRPPPSPCSPHSSLPPHWDPYWSSCNRQGAKLRPRSLLSPARPLNRNCCLKDTNVQFCSQWDHHAHIHIPLYNLRTPCWVPVFREKLAFGFVFQWLLLFCSSCLGVGSVSFPRF